MAGTNYAGITPETIAAISGARSAQSQLNGLSNNPATIQALRQANTPYTQVSGQGLSTTAPGALEAVGNIMLRNKGSQGIREMQAQSDALRGQVRQGAEAELMMGLQQKQQARADTVADNAQARGYAVEDRDITAANTLKKSMAAQAAKDDDRTTVPFHDPNNPERVLNLQQDANGNWYDTANNPIDGNRVKNLTPYTASTTTGSTGYKAQVDAKDEQKALDATLDSLDYLDTTLQDPNLKAGTGSWADPVKQFSEVTGLMPETQVATNRMRKVMLNSITPILSSKVFGKISDGDREVIQSVFANEKTEPLVLLKEIEDTVKPALFRALRDGGREELIPQVEAKIAGIVKRGYKAQYPDMYNTIYGAEVIGSNNATGAVMYPNDPAKQARFDAFKARQAGAQ